MRLDSLKIRNFRGFKEEAFIDFSDLTAFIGKNDIGKSTILEALEIFFNSSIVSCEQSDFNVELKDSSEKEIEITCEFSDLPEELIIDSNVPTSLKDEFLLNFSGKLEIMKKYNALLSKPKETVYIICNHPTKANANDLLSLKNKELKDRAKSLNIDSSRYDSKVNSDIRRSIWSSFDDLELQNTCILVDKDDSKKVFEEIKKYLPYYALFQSDRKSTDDDKEIVDPMKIAIREALSKLSKEIEDIKKQVQTEACGIAEMTLSKLREMDPSLASTLSSDFKSEPKFDSLFKLTINGDNGIPINKRGSGVRRLILMNFFRAEAERRMKEANNNSVIYAFEEPETSLHPDHQKMLIKAFLNISKTSNSQVILTTHTPAIAALLPLSSLRFIDYDKEGSRCIFANTEDTYKKICDALGVLPDPIHKDTKALLLVEGKADYIFVEETAMKLKDKGYLKSTFKEKNFAIIPVGGCGNLKHWMTLNMAKQFNVPYCVLMDSDCGTEYGVNNIDRISELRADGVKAYTTKKREIENYIHCDCINDYALIHGKPTLKFSFSDTDDAKNIISKAINIKPTEVLEKLWCNMSADQIRETEKYCEADVEHFEFTEMFTDFLTLVK